MSTKAKPIKVAIVGGGCASLCTAFELSRPHLADQYEITVYQQGWRLGGKGASGRGVANRIEEHGLHLWMGFYENAFRLMRESYAERHSKHPDLRFAQWHEAFSPAPNVGVTNTSQDGWDFWLAHFPAIAGEPGDPNNPETLSVATYLRHTVTLLGELLQSAFRGREPTQPSGEANTSFSTFETLVSNADRAIKAGQFAGLTATVELWQLLRAATLQFFPDAYGGEAMLPIRLVDQLTQLVEQHAETIAAQDQDLEKVWHVIDLVLACLKGTIRHGLVYDPRGFDAINDYDWRDWLQENGASKAALDSGFMRGIYDLTFAYEDGDVERPRLAAGVALRGALRMFFTYRGSLFWKMNGGMGDIVFAPLYQVLKDRGVRFKFFHRLTNVELGQTDTVETLHFDIQAKTKKGRYEPLINIHQMPSWPAQPDYSQLKKGAELERRGINFEASWEDHSAAKRALKVGDDFDAVVLGVSVGALPSVAPELIERSSRWKTMVANVKTVATQAFQTWMSASTEELGWSVAGANISGYVEPFDTWADMSHLIPEESWRQPVNSIAYFCSVLPDHTQTPSHKQAKRQHKAVRHNAVQFLQRDASVLWPKWVDANGRPRWSLLTAQADQSHANSATKKRFDTQFWTANMSPTDRYVLSLPGSTQYRLSPLDLDFDNLTVAGDWTATGLDSGCVESAVISGQLAAHAISGAPELDTIVGYDHP